ncbi:hypothetical protein PHMEG_00025185 [Phytophthora megakarya]|uniref:Uncharacterized protein n=1 Tax=Phytophthora megakarya TaxID=4795 RepID=A0A225VEA5_9STRA|nr:hypothetical protein PHMEG_00025185 [Phytophthora megakarya]
MHLQWLAVVENAPPDDAVAFLETFKAYRITKCNVVPCTICMYPEPHTMSYRLMNCTSPACKLMHSHGKCQWRGRRLDAVNADRNTPLMETHKTYIREMTAQGSKPSRIRNSVPRKFGVDMDSLPSLSKVHNYAYHYKNTKLFNHDKHKDITEFVHKLEFSGHENETAAFTFVWTLDEFGKMLVGNGSDENPFVGGISTKRCYVQTQSSRLSGDCLWNFRSVQKFSFGGPICQFTMN